jgi:hypothetical protein
MAIPLRPWQIELLNKLRPDMDDDIELSYTLHESYTPAGAPDAFIVWLDTSFYRRNSEQVCILTHSLGGRNAGSSLYFRSADSRARFLTMAVLKWS